MSFCSLHNHTSFSFRDGYGLPAQIADRLAELGQPACGCSDHGNVFAHVSWQKELTKRGIKPIFGCEFYCSQDVETKGHQALLDKRCWPHVTVLAATQKGYENLLQLSSYSWDHAFRFPQIDWEALARWQEGLVVMSGCIGGWPTRLMEHAGDEAAREFLRTWSERIERFYIELNPAPRTKESISERTLARLVAIADDLRLPTVLTADAHFPRPEDHPYQDILFASSIRERVTTAPADRKARIPEYDYYCTEEEILARARETAPEVPEAIWQQSVAHTATIAASCAVELPRAERVSFYGLKPGETAEERLQQEMQRGICERDAQGLIPRDVANGQRYADRARHEFRTLCDKGFADYILAITDVVREMKQRGHLVVTRGSAGGCLLLWLLGASETDPLRHGLSFERFYDANRPDPPDVDVDFEQARRDEALDYLRECYGATQCANIAALSQLKPKSAVQEVASAYGIPRAEIAPLTAALTAADDSVERQIDAVSDPKALAILQRYPQLRMAAKLVGQFRQSSIHAAGVLVSPTPLWKSVGLVRGKERQVVAAIDKRGAAELGFLKMDFLSVRSLDVVAAAVRLLEKPMAWLYGLPLDDPSALSIGQSGALAGIFQLDGASAARVARTIGLDTFDDLVAASALCRPGPGDWVDVYAENKGDAEKFAAYLADLHPVAAEIVRPTFGILLYQEQVMALARNLAGLDWPDVQKLRKDIGNKMGEHPDEGVRERWRAEWSAKFVGGCTARGVPEREAQFWWGSIQSHGGYSFNKSHCVTYALVGYWMLYLKAHHSAEFYEAYCSLEVDAITLKRLIREFCRAGGDVRLIDPHDSRRTFCSPRPAVLVGGYLNLHGVGNVTAERIKAKGPFATWTDFLGALPKRTAERLRATGAPAVAIGGGEWDPQETIVLAPWFPTPTLAPQDAQTRGEFKLPSLATLPAGEIVPGDVAVCGYVTATRFEQNRVMFCLEDETETILVRIPSRQVKEIGPRFRELQIADFVLVTGWWSGDTLYAKDRLLIRRRPAPMPEMEPGARSRPPVPDRVITDDVTTDD